MTQALLDSSVAAITGEPLAVIRGRGFGPLSGSGPDPEEVRLVLDCPFCRRPVPRPGDCPDGSRPMAECLPCDLYFDFGDDEIYVDPA